MGCSTSAEFKQTKENYMELKKSEEASRRQQQEISTILNSFRREVENITSSMNNEIQKESTLMKVASSKIIESLDGTAEHVQIFKTDILAIRKELDAADARIEASSKIQTSILRPFFNSFLGTKAKISQTKFPPLESFGDENLRASIDSLHKFHPEPESEPVEADEYSRFIPVPEQSVRMEEPDQSAVNEPSTPPPPETIPIFAAPPPPPSQSNRMPPIPTTSSPSVKPFSIPTPSVVEEDEEDDDDKEKAKVAPVVVDTIEIVVNNVGKDGLGILGDAMKDVDTGAVRFEVSNFKDMGDDVPNPSETAGLQKGDRIEKVNGKSFKAQKDVLVAMLKAKGRVVLTVSRPAGWGDQVD